MIKDLIISTLLTFIIWKNLFVVHPHPFLLIPMIWIWLTVVILVIDEHIRKEWFYQ